MGRPCSSKPPHGEGLFSPRSLYHETRCLHPSPGPGTQSAVEDQAPIPRAGSGAWRGPWVCCLTWEEPVTGAWSPWGWVLRGGPGEAPRPSVMASGSKGSDGRTGLEGGEGLWLARSTGTGSPTRRLHTSSWACAQPLLHAALHSAPLTPPHPDHWGDGHPGRAVSFLP